MNPWEAYKKGKEQEQQRSANSPWEAYKKERQAQGLPPVTRKYQAQIERAQVSIPKRAQTMLGQQNGRTALAMTSAAATAEKAFTAAQERADTYNRYRNAYDSGRDVDTVNAEYQQAYDRVRNLDKQISDANRWEQDAAGQAMIADLQRQKTAAEAQLRSLNEELGYAQYFYQTDSFAELPQREDYAEKAEEGEALYAQYRAAKSEDFASDRALTMQLALSDETSLSGLASQSAALNRLDKAHKYAADLSALTEEEKQSYYYLLATDADKALEYYDAVRQMHREAELEKISEWAGHNIGTQALASAASVALLPYASSDLFLTNDEYGNRYGVGLGEVRDTLRGGVSQKYNEQFGTINEDVPVLGGQGLGNLYQLGMSMADSAVSAAFGSGGTVLLSGSAASSAYTQAKKSGATEGQALLQGLAQGIAEGLFEYVSIDKLLSQDVSESFIKNALKQAGVEASEEAMTSIANEITDRLIMQDKSTYEQAVQKYMAEGMTLEQAQEKAGRDFANTLAQDALGGFLSGAGMTAGNYAGTYAVATAQGRREAKGMMGKVGTQQWDATAKAAGVEASDSDRTVRSKMAKYYRDVALGKRMEVKQEAQAQTEPTAQAAQQIPPQDETTAETQKTAQTSEVFALYGFADDAAYSAGAVIDKVRAGEHITNKDIDKLNLFTDAGVAAVNEALGTNMRRQNTASNMRKAFREAVQELRRTEDGSAPETVAQGESPAVRSDEGAAVKQEPSVGAAESGFDPYTKAANEYGTIEAGENPTRIVDVPKSTTGEDRVGRLVRTAMEAKITPEHMIPEIEQKVIEGQFSKRPQKNREQLGRAMNWRKRQSDVNEAYETWKETAISEGVSAQNNARGMLLYNELLRAAENASNGKKRSEYKDMALDVLVRLNDLAVEGGRATQIWRLIKKLSPEMQYVALEKSVKRINEKLEARRRFDGRQIRLDETLVEAWMDALRSGKGVEATQAALYQSIAEQVPRTAADMWNAWRYLAMLGNFRTVIRNTAGNAAMSVQKVVRDKLAAIGEAFIQKEERTKYFGILEASESGRAALAFARDEYGRMKDRLKNSGRKYDDGVEQGLAKAIRDKNGKFKFKPLAKYQEFWNWMLENEAFGDTAFLRVHYVNTLAQIIKARGYTMEQIQNGGISEEKLDDMNAKAIQEALKATFRDTNAFTKLVTGIRTQGKTTGQKIANIAIEGLLPFKATPANIVVRATEYGPLGLLKAVTVDAVRVARGDITAVEFIENLAEGLTGTGIVALGWWLASCGIVVADADDDDERKGHQSYSIVIGGKSYTLDWLAPTAIPFFMGASAFSEYKSAQEGALTLDVVVDAVSGMLDPMLEMSMLSGISDLLDTMAYGSDGVELSDLVYAFAVSPFLSYLGQAVPTLLGQAERLGEPTSEYTYTGDADGRFSKVLRKGIAKIFNKIPGADPWQADYVDEWGNIETTGNVLERFINNFINPAYVSDITESDIEDEITRLEEVTGDSYAPSRRGYTITLYDEETETSEKIKLDAEQYTRYQQTYGQQAALMLGALISSDYYAEMTDTERGYAIDRIYSLADEYGKYAAGVGYEMQGDDADRKLYDLVEAGVPVAEAFAARLYREQLNDDESAGTSSEKAVQFKTWVQGQDWGASQKGAVLEAYGTFWSQTRSSTEKYDAMVSSGISAEAAEDMILRFGALEPADKSQARYDYQVAHAKTGESVSEQHASVQTWQKLEVIANNSALTEAQQWEAMKLYTDSKTLDAFKDSGIAPWVYAAYLKAQSEQDTGTWSLAKLNKWLDSTSLDTDVKIKIRKIYKSK